MDRTAAEYLSVLEHTFILVNSKVKACTKALREGEKEISKDFPKPQELDR